MMRSLFFFAATLAVAHGQQCKKFSAIYRSGKELCENMWDGAFVYETNPAYGYDPRPTQSGSRSIDVTQAIKRMGGHPLGDFFDYNATTHMPNQCINSADTQHFDTPTSTNLGASPCNSWQEASCCKSAVVETASKLNAIYGESYSWDRCGALSPKCRQYFVLEACLYECEPASAFFQKHPHTPDAKDHPHYYNASNTSHSSWSLWKMPLKASFCDAWLSDCADDSFCSEDGGSFFSCQRINNEPAPTDVIVHEDSDLKSGYIALIIVICVVALVAIAFIAYMIFREKSGKPIYYTPVSRADVAGEPAATRDAELDVVQDS
eukprot:TRINITY_DN51300_c0_g1_i1.p1 TRINITY_DN51300_c0_g1~~TRINITY_DN51300_c0_g1_i1.p1  ORF type:complete len:336 (+),score=116.54 TRINITY_DN51300_c0_g1_i1:47-1009(+)